MGSTSTILVITLVALLVVVIITMLVLRNTGAFGSGVAKRTRAEPLAQSGRRARATVVTVQPTGMVVNDLNMQCIIGFRVQPLDGGAPFDAQRKMLVSQTAAPHPGEVWPCRYDPADPTHFIVDHASAPADHQLGRFRNLGVAHPADPPAS